MRSARGASTLGVGLALTLGLVAGAGAAGPGTRETPPPTPVPPNASPSPFVTDLHTPAPSPEEPDIGSPAAALADLDTGQILWAKNPGARRPIASVTKIMTALLVIERTHPDDVLTVSKRAAPGGPTIGISNLGLLPGERIAVKHLLYALMLQSANDAALALAEHVSGSVEAFVRAMNRRARALGLRDTVFFSPNGLDDRGRSSARDLVRLTMAAYDEPSFARITATKFHEVPSAVGDPRVVQNRNVLLWLYRGGIGVKTGFTSAAGFCVVVAAEREGIRLVAVVLGSPGEAFSDAAEMLNHGFAAFDRRTFVTEGEAVGSLELQGGTVTVATAGSLEALVPEAAIDEIVEVPVADPGAAFPPAPGERVGTLTVRAPGLLLGRVPLVAAEIPPPPRPGDPLLARVLDAVFGGLADAFGALLD